MLSEMVASLLAFAASPATGSAKAHRMEQKTLVNLALG